ncbi:MAG: glycosyltransferase family 9 protein [Saprospiraceae bacterium]
MNIPTGNIIISRTDAIGDVILTLPLVGFLKKLNPNNKIIFLGRTYTKPIIDTCIYVDHFINWDEVNTLTEVDIILTFQRYSPKTILFVFPDKKIAQLAKKAAIPIRVGTAHRWYFWLYANYKPFFSRRNSDLHEAQLNFQLLKPFGEVPVLDEKNLHALTGLEKIKQLPENLKLLIDPKKINIVLHPRSRGSSREWGVSNFEKLIHLLPSDRFKLYVTGTNAEGDSMPDLLKNLPDHCVDMTGKLSLDELISFINSCDGIVACSTGPLHIAAVLGKKAIGIYPPMRPLHPGRWKPLGPNVFVFCLEKICNDCKNGGSCNCIAQIQPEEIVKALEKR